jgi:hypothetical protein
MPATSAKILAGRRSQSDGTAFRHLGYSGKNLAQDKVDQRAGAQKEHDYYCAIQQAETRFSQAVRRGDRRYYMIATLSA